MTNKTLYFTSAYQEAFLYAFDLHKTQFRKGSQRPYMSHLMAVSGLVMEHGGDEIEAIAGLLHDAVEDQGGIATLEEIHLKFGAQVASIVEACTDSITTPKPPWRERKEDYLNKLENASSSVVLVSQADKLHNLRSIYADYLLKGDDLWQYFRGGREGSLWYYHQLVKVFHQHGDSSMLHEIEKLLKELVLLVDSQDSK